ncbi:uncharacterized protein BXZ73DRAFT_77479 [Epithele typhae]|uniref:uncharacterized protein n=1 Tax=Epithele typhae TaxID=378194 RepID=UPI0020078D8B|nr:uncharacterized protein BXZ73DRAFT_77479 [Epithele typhae]KAH9932781.1 hypothetical protein BXZ73DRAFT_77479 [Epithele typhae]
MSWRDANATSRREARYICGNGGSERGGFVPLERWVGRFESGGEDVGGKGRVGGGSSYEEGNLRGTVDVDAAVLSRAGTDCVEGEPVSARSGYLAKFMCDETKDLQWQVNRRGGARIERLNMVGEVGWRSAIGEFERAHEVKFFPRKPDIHRNKLHMRQNTHKMAAPCAPASEARYILRSNLARLARAHNFDRGPGVGSSSVSTKSNADAKMSRASCSFAGTARIATARYSSGFTSRLAFFSRA